MILRATHQRRLKKLVGHWVCTVVAASVTCCAGPATGVIIYGGSGIDAPANTAAPTGFEDAWARVATNGNGSAVYLGNGFVLTAAHVSNPATITIDEFDYNRLNSGTILTNPNGTDSDLRLFRIAVPNDTPLYDMDVLPILDSSLATSVTQNQVDGILIGTGVGQTTLQPIALGAEGGPAGNGFVWNNSTTRDKRWANAEIGKPGTVPEIAGRTIQEGFRSAFRFTAEQDGIAANNDSGASLFYDNGSEVVLVGLVHSVTRANFARQNDETFLSDLAEYRDQINITIGDLDGDGSVGESDLGLILNNFGTNVQAGNFFEGDADGDGFVGVNDLDFVLSKWNNGPAPALSSFAVPEPTSLVLLGGALLGLAARRRR